jgi:RimJ/RimL family protein N-acetyltransferase
MNNPFLIGSKIYLRAAEAGDAEMAALCENHPDPRSFLFYGLPSSLEDQREKIHKARQDAHMILFTVCDRQTDQAIGQTAFHRIDWLGRMAIFYIAIAESKNWSKGYGLEATELMVRYAFSTLNLNRLQLHVLCKNERAVHVYKKAGFQIEGTLRKAMYFENKYHDFYVMGLLRDEWQIKHKNNHI